MAETASTAGAASAAAGMTQMNVRIDAATKSAGDAALANAGYTPSSAARTLWSYAAAHADSPESIAELLSTAQADADARRAECRREKTRLVQEGPRIVEAFRERVGTAGASAKGAKPRGAADYDDVLFATMMERAEERRGS